MNPLVFATSASLSYLRSHLPPPVYDFLSGLFVNAYAVYLFVADYLPEGFIVQRIVPPLLSLLTIYFALTSAYRTALLAVRSAWFILKLSILVGIIAFFLGGSTRQGMLNALAGSGGTLGTFGDYVDSMLAPDTAARRRAQSSRKRRPPRTDQPPSIFDSFASHRAYAERTKRRQGSSEPAAGASDDPITVDQIVQQVQSAWQENGRYWWSAVGRMAGFTEPGEEERQERSRTGRTRTR
jgi:hypothetical protein